MHLVRTLQIEHNSNMAVVGMAIVGFMVGLGLGVADNELLVALGDGLNLALSLFLAWAIARELDPDRPGVAVLAGFLAVGVWLLLDRSSLLASVAVLLAARILVRSTGRPPGNIDFGVLTALAWFASHTVAGWVSGLGLAYALARDVRLPGPALKYQRPVAFAVAAAATGGLFIRGPALDPAWSLFAILVVVVGIAAGLVTPTPAPVSTPDHGDQPIPAERVVAARRAVLVIVIFGALTGSTGVAHLGPVWAVLPTLPLFDLIKRGNRRSGRQQPADRNDAAPAHAQTTPAPPEGDRVASPDSPPAPTPRPTDPAPPPAPSPAAPPGPSPEPGPDQSR